MRQIKFRGKRLDNNEWVCGSLDLTGNETIISWDKTDSDGDQVVWFAKVDPETVGQFTGLHDNNDKEIYEGDIIHSPNGNIIVVKYGYKEHVVKHDDFVDSYAAYGWIVENIQNGMTDFLDNEFLQGEVIGNIHDPDKLTSDFIDANADVLKRLKENQT